LSPFEAHPQLVVWVGETKHTIASGFVARRLTRVAPTIVGTAASFVLLTVGLILVEISLWLAREWRDVSIVLIVGSIALLMS
jgi:hypothetical protein